MMYSWTARAYMRHYIQLNSRCSLIGLLLNDDFLAAFGLGMDFAQRESAQVIEELFEATGTWWVAARAFSLSQ